MTDVAAVRAAVDRVGGESVVAVLTTTSCFAPRGPDDLPAVAAICKEVTPLTLSLGCAIFQKKMAK